MGGKETRQRVWRLGRRLLRYLYAYRLRFISAVLVMATFALVSRGRLVLVEPLLDNPKGWDFHLVLIFVGVSLLTFPSRYYKEYLVHYISQGVLMDLRNDLSGHVLRLPLRFFHDRKSGDLLSRLTNDTVLMQQVINFFLESIILQPFMLAVGVGLIVYAHWLLGILAIALFPAYALPLLIIGRAMRQARRKSLERLGGMTESVVQTYSGIRIVKSFHMEDEEDREFRSLNKGFFRKVIRMVRKKALMEGIVELFVSLGVAVLILLAWFLIRKENMTPGQIAVFCMGLAAINTAVKELAKAYSRLQEALAGAERIFEVLDAPPEVPDEPDAVDLPSVESIEYKDVGFRYETDLVLRDINVRARPGEVLAVVGPSGAGKSTFVDLLFRFYDPQKGRIEANGVDLRKLKRASLLSHIAVVTQETFLFNATVAENILYGRRDATREEVEAAARAAHIHDFVMTMEKGYDTVVGERGGKLSGGQRQRIAIARAVLRNPSILILDEATSSLDTESEQAVQAALGELMRSDRRITFVIAHRLSTVRDADRILVLDKGKLVEEGTHDELLGREGVYAGLYRTQFVS